MIPWLLAIHHGREILPIQTGHKNFKSLLQPSQSVQELKLYLRNLYGLLLTNIASFLVIVSVFWTQLNSLNGRFHNHDEIVVCRIHTYCERESLQLAHSAEKELISHRETEAFDVRKDRVWLSPVARHPRSTCVPCQATSHNAIFHAPPPPTVAGSLTAAVDFNFEDSDHMTTPNALQWRRGADVTHRTWHLQTEAASWMHSQCHHTGDHVIRRTPHLISHPMYPVLAPTIMLCQPSRHSPWPEAGSWGLVGDLIHEVH